MSPQRDVDASFLRPRDRTGLSMVFKVHAMVADIVARVKGVLALMRDDKKSKRLKCWKNGRFFRELLLKMRSFLLRDVWASTGFRVSVKEDARCPRTVVAIMRDDDKTILRKKTLFSSRVNNG